MSATTAAPVAPGDYRSIWMHLIDTPFRQDWVDVGGVRTRYLQAGRADAPTVLMLHGTAGSFECFAPNIASHAQHFNCLAIDMVGSGFTDKPDRDYQIPDYVAHAHGFLKVMGVKRASIIGVSLGAWVACRFALTYPDMTDKLSLMSAAGMFANLENMKRIRGGRSKAVEDPRWENIKPIFDHLLYKEESRIPDIIAVRQAAYRQPQMARAMQHILCLQDPDIRPRNLISEAEWKSIKNPALLIGAADDPDEYLDTARIVSRLMPNARYVEMREVGHWPQFENPEVFNKLNLDFLLGR